MKKKAIIIGSGFGGLSLAIRLQSKGLQTTIFEKNEKVGGHAYQMKTKGYTFDMGPSLITAPEIIERIFEEAGKSLYDYLDLIPLHPYYRIYFHDKTYIDYSGNTEDMKEQISQYSPEDASQYDNFMNYASQVYKAVIVDGLGSEPFISLKSFLTFIPKALRLGAFSPVYTTVKKYFKHENTRFLFSFHPLFIGGNPFRAPSVYLMIPYLEKVGGVWFTKGGMYSLVKAMEKLFLEIGGKIRTNTEVDEILIKDGAAYGVRSGDEVTEADIVVSNAHFAHTYSSLIKESARKKWKDKKVNALDYSMSCVLIYLGVKKKYPQLLHHTLILSKRYEGLIEDIFEKKILSEDFSMYLHIPTRTDPEMAPKGCESIYVLIPVPNLKSGIKWEDVGEAYTDKIINYLEKDFGMQDLKRNIEVKKSFYPSDFAKDRNNYLGSAWGVEPKLIQTAYLRPHNKSEDIKNLYLVGASTHPGAGVPGVMLTAETTAKLILENLE